MPRLTVAIPQPCRENWQAMTPAAQGRHCAACDKVVVDFTRMTDAEVVAYLSRPSGPSCGRFRAEQLGRPLRATAEAPASRRWLAAALALLGLGVAGPAAAQTRSAAPQEQRVLLRKTVAPVALAPMLPPVVVRGRAVDQENGQPLPGVTISVPGTTLATATAADGTFELLVPRSAFTGRKPRLHIQAAFVGYQTQDINHKLGHDVFLNVELKMQGIMLGGIAFVPEPTSWLSGIFTAFQQAFRPNSSSNSPTGNLLS
jgi:CarboxypepD_reg-like domain